MTKRLGVDPTTIRRQEAVEPLEAVGSRQYGASVSDSDRGPRLGRERRASFAGA
jgi:hypothetical protein